MVEGEASKERPQERGRPRGAWALAGAVVAFLAALATIAVAFKDVLADAPQVVVVTSSPSPLPACPSNGDIGGDNAAGIEVHARVPGRGCWTTVLDPASNQADTDVQIHYVNTSKQRQDHVVVRANLPPLVSLVPGSTQAMYGSDPAVHDADTDAITRGGIEIGSYAPGGGAVVKFAIRLPFDGELACGTNEFRLVGVVRPEGQNEFYNTVIMTVYRNCA